MSFSAAVPYLEHKVTISPQALLLFLGGGGWRCCSSTQWEKGAGERLKRIEEGQEAQGAAAAVVTSESTAKRCPFHSFPHIPSLQ